MKNDRCQGPGYRTNLFLKLETARISKVFRISNSQEQHSDGPIARCAHDWYHVLLAGVLGEISRLFRAVLKSSVNDPFHLDNV